MTIDLKTYLTDGDEQFPLATTLVMRHTPIQKKIRENLGIWSVERPDQFNTYQCTQAPKQENMLKRATHLVSFIGQKSDDALFVGVYENRGHHKMTADEIEKQRKLYGSSGDELWFELELTQKMADLKGKLVIGWPPPVISFARFATPNNVFPVKAIHAESHLIPEMPSWRKLRLTYAELKTLPKRWRDRLKEWRAIYLVHDTTDGKNYVGSAYGDENLDQRWAEYARTGHGGNVELIGRKYENFRFSILEIVGHNMPPEELEAIEQSWMLRLHTRVDGLNTPKETGETLWVQE